MCLANSYKLNHRCIARLRTDGSGWIRPVAGNEHGELEYRHYPAVAAVIVVPLGWHSLFD
jgi:hypothetical protein